MKRIIFVVILLVLIPTFLWGTIDWSWDRFSSVSIAFNSLGQLCGLIGLSLYAFNLVLSARFSFIEKLFGELNKIYVAHHLIGIVVWGLLLFHPVGLIATYGIELLIPFYGNWARNFGLASLLLFSSLIILTLFVKLPYQIWKSTHQYLGLVFILGVIHALFVPSDISSSIPLKLYCFTLLILSMVGYIYRVSPLNRYLVKKHLYRVGKIVKTGEITQIFLKAVSKPFNLIPGQFAFFKFQSPNFSETHPFSVVFSDNALSIVVKNSGDFTSNIASVPVGTLVKIEGPYGKFSYYFHNRPKQIWVAGGIGITPFLTMLDSLPKNTYTVHLYYVVHSESETFALPEIQKKATEKSIKLITWFSDKKKHLTAEDIVSLSGDIKKADIFICGPSPMMKSLRKQLNEKGARHSHIHTEEFSLY